MEMIAMAEVESFKLDYTKVITPYVRKIDVQYGKKRRCYYKF
ncbi:partial S-ribosylhomocysteine lyase [Streptococcus mutans LJ23]|nr:partial S-ribosylhomocysteine lyase [Streptococcus mutans LJ23]